MSGISANRPNIKPEIQKSEIVKQKEAVKNEVKDSAKDTNIKEKEPNISKDEIKGGLEKLKQHSSDANQCEFHPNKKEEGKDSILKELKKEHNDGGINELKKELKHDGGLKELKKELHHDGGLKELKKEHNHEGGDLKELKKDSGNDNELKELKKQITQKPQFNIPFRDTDGDGFTNIKYACVFATRSKIS